MNPSKRDVVGKLMGECNPERLAMLDKELPECFWPIEEWPLHHIRTFLAARITFADRKPLTLFLLSNGMPPLTWVKWCEAQPGYLRYDDSAKNLASVIKRMSQGEWAAGTLHAAKIWWMAEKRLIEGTVTPPWVKDPFGMERLVYEHGCVKRVEYLGNDWVAACNELDRYSKTLPREKNAPCVMPPPRPFDHFEFIRRKRREEQVEKSKKAKIIAI